MARESFIFDETTKALVPRGEFYARKLAPRFAVRSDLPTPRIQSDSIIPGMSMVSGKWHDSLSSLKQDYRDYGARTGKEVEIVGDQVHHLMKEPDHSADEKAIDEAIHHAIQRHS